MASLSYAISLTEAINLRIGTEVTKATTAPLLTNSEKAESELAKMRAMDALDSTIAIVQNALSKLQKPRRNAATKQSGATLAEQPRRIMVKAANLNPRARALGEAISGESSAKNLIDQMSAEGMKEPTKNLNDMANAIEPIITSFDKVLEQPNLKNYCATLNTVPVVGIKGNKIMYTQKNPNASDTWAVFSSLPADAVATPDAKNVFLFPFEGDLCLAIGQKVWRKAHRPQLDEAGRAKAVDNWPNLYVDYWKKEGDLVLPSADLRGVVPFSTLSADRREIDFHLLVLQSDSSLAFLQGGIIDNAVFKPLIFEASNGISAAPKFMRVAYWDDQIVAYDDANNIWNIKVNFSAGTFSVADKAADEPITELTATEIGPVIMRGDGFLYKRIVPVKSDGAAAFTWTKWIAQDGVSHLGVASPGVILDLNLLTRTLRSRYVETQTALYPIVNQISAYCTTHNVFLGLLRNAFDEYTSANGESAKEAIAVQEGKKFVPHAKVWAKILHDSTISSKESVNIMTRQLSDVHTQLKIQLSELQDRLVGLKETLDVQNDAMHKLRAAFWGSIAAVLLGVAIIVLGSGMGPLAVIAGGALMVAGIVSAFVFGKKMADLAGDIAGTESQISQVSTAITEMTSVVKSYDDLDEKYGILNTFWGAMYNDANVIGTMDDATAALIGASLLADESSIIAAMQMTTEMGGACTKYLETLNKQGIKVPEGSSTVTVSAHMRVSKRERRGVGKHHHTIQDPHALFLHHVDEGTKRLTVGDSLGYQAAMDRACLLSCATNASAAELKVKTGLWFDVPALTSSATVWNGFRASIEVASMNGRGVSEDPGKLNGSLDESKPFVVSMLQQTVKLGSTVLQWSSQFPTPAKDDRKNAAKKAALQQCGAALDSAAKAKNKFSDFQQQATKFQQDREADINGQKDTITAAQASARAAADHIDIPPALYASFLIPVVGVVALHEYEAKRRAEIEDDLGRRVAELEGTINHLRELQQSGTSFHANALTWIQMCEQVSGNLGGIYNTLTALDGQVLEDPTLYSSLMETEWTTIKEGATAVQDILNIHTPLTISSHLVPSGMFSLRRGPVRDAASQPTESELQLFRSLSPDANLAMSLDLQAESADKVFEALNVISRLPYVSGLVAFWDEAKVDRTTLLDITNQVRNQYVQLVATEYDLIQKLSGLSILQELRPVNVAAGTLPLDVFVKVSFNSFDDAYQSANRTLSSFEKSASDLDFTMTQVNSNLTNMQQQMDKLAVDISKMDEARKEVVYSYIATVITTAVSSALAFVSAKGVPGPKKVPASITSTLLEAGKKGLDAATTADNLELAIKNLKLAEVMQVIHTMQLVKRDCDATVKQLTAVQPLFRDLVDGLKDASASVMKSRNELQKILQNVQVLDQLSMSTEDAGRIGSAWQSVKDATQTWLSTINRQGISPVTYSVRANI